MTQLMAKSPIKKPRGRLVKATTKKGRRVETPKEMIKDQTPEVAAIMLAERKRAWENLEDILVDSEPSEGIEEEEPV